MPPGNCDILGKIARASNARPYKRRGRFAVAGYFPLWGGFCRKDGKIGVSVRWTNDGGCDIIHIYKIPPLKEEVLW